MARKKKEDTQTDEIQEVKEVKAVKKPAQKAESIYGYSFLDHADEVSEKVQETIHTLSARRKNKPTQFKSFGDVEREMIPVHDLPLKYLFDNPGFPSGGLIEIIGAEGTGKSSLVHYLEGVALLNGSPVYHQECENKPLRKNHVARIMHSNPAMAKRLVKALHYDTARSVVESYQKLIDWIEVMRGKQTGGRKASVSIPMHVPLIAVIDPWGKLMSQDEAQGFYDFGDNMSDKQKDIIDHSNMGHAKAAHRMVRRLPYILGENNVTLFLIQHQNDKVDMSGKGGPQLAADAAALFNVTKVGGKAFNQLDSMQILLSRKGLVKNSGGDTVGKTIRARMHKNSWGAESRVIEYDLHNDKYVDIPASDKSEGYLDRVIRFDRYNAEWLAENKAIDCSIKLRRISAPVLELTGATYTEFYRALHADTDILDQTAKNLKIQGYHDPLETIEGSIGESLQDGNDWGEEDEWGTQEVSNGEADSDLGG
jgi:RecA/RadA recombinase